MGNLNSAERTAAELVLFGLGFIAFLIWAGGIATASAAAAVIGTILLLFVVFCFRLRGGDDD
jgi:hypothetical protein